MAHGFKVSVFVLFKHNAWRKSASVRREKKRECVLLSVCVSLGEFVS